MSELQLEPIIADDVVWGRAYYEMHEVDAIIAQKNKEIAELKATPHTRDSVVIEKMAAEIAELKDKCQMHDFFWEGCGFKKRGFKNSIAVAERFEELEKENARLKGGIKDLQDDRHSSVKLIYDKNIEIAELEAKVAQLEDDVAFWKAKAKGEM